MMKREVSVGVVMWQKLNRMPLRHTTANSVFAIRFAHLSAFGTSRTHNMLRKIAYVKT